MRWHWYDFVQLIGSIASVTGLSLLGSVTPEIRGIVLGLIVVGLFSALIASMIARAQPMTKVGRLAMIDTGKSLIRGVKTEVIMFGGDMSWAADYEEAIRFAADRGKRITVLFPASSAPKVIQNADVLVAAGAKLQATRFDAGLRAILVDPEDENDALLYVTNRRLKRGIPEIQAGEKGTEATYDYVAKIYRTRRDALLIHSVRKIATVTLHNSSPWTSPNNHS